ncbi:sigma-70 family RNA polymerase sigma factor [Cerasicoccus maritimus]|uniref:sigma-70 family RNA polymerase sigma factor n=1 Tax=Cerasicoccus maritimus TaxID=490089 RepID=UPI0028527455|nr:sigma-70 family RNA polymerase sigma factor [Cerasicoccus maritimus]
MSVEDRSVRPHLMSGLGRVQSKDEQVSERLCRKTISRHRVQVDYLLHVPDWDALYQPGLEDLSLPLPRRGINLRSLLDSLLVEYKQQLAQWVIAQYRGRFPSSQAKRIARIWALDGLEEPMGETLNFSEWLEFKERLLSRMKLEHNRYKKAQTILFRRYQSLLHKLVNRQVFDPGQRSDAYQEASLGLIHAIDKVEDSGASFGSYARTWITRQIRNYLMGERFPVHVPINLASRLLREGNEAQRRGEDDKKTKRPGDPAPRTKEELSPFHELLHPGVPLDAPTGDDEAPRQLADDLAQDPHERLSRKDLHAALRGLMSELTDKQREVLALRFGLNEGNRQWTLSEIAQEVGISHQQVSQREKRALEKLESVLRPLYEEMNAL